MLRKTFLFFAPLAAALSLPGVGMARDSDPLEKAEIQNIKQELQELTPVLVVGTHMLLGDGKNTNMILHLNRIKRRIQMLHTSLLIAQKDPVYGSITALGSITNNAVNVLAIRGAPDAVATGWSDTDAGTFHAYRWTLASGTQDIGTLLGSAGNSIAYGVSDDASTIVGWSNTTPGQFPSGQHAVRWTQAGGMQDLGSLFGTSGTSIAYATNRDGTVVVGVTQMPTVNGITQPNRAFRWTQAGGMQSLGGLGAGLGSEALAVSEDGNVVVGRAFTSNGTHAFRWTQAGGMQDLGTLSGLNWATATSVSGDGNIIVGYADSSTALLGSTGWTLSQNSRPFRWTQATGLQDLNTVLANGGANMTGVLAYGALSISRDGIVISGISRFPTTGSGQGDPFAALFCDAANAAACVRTKASVNTHDFDGFGTSDILWRDTGGNTALWMMNGASVSSALSLPTVPTTWSIAGQRDFDGDGATDLLWRDGSGNTSIWFMNRGTVVSSFNLGTIPPSWSVVGTRDLNADYRGDILWRDTSGNVAVWLIDGAAVTASASLGNVPGDWSIIGTADFDGNQRGDILWRNATTGDVAIWFLNGTTLTSSAYVANVPGWNIVATGDFNGDGKADLLWRDSSGNTAIWTMNGGAVTGSAALGQIPAPWIVAETGDFNGDGKSDILWRNTTSGDTAIWFMDGTSVTGSSVVATVPPIWTIQNTNVN